MIVVVVQARLGSSRLPAKVLKDVCGATVLSHVIQRAKAIPGVDLVCCAIPDSRDNDRLADAAVQAGATVSRGPEAHVLMRYLIAARATGAEVVMRITSDCPLLDPQVSGQVLSDFVAGGVDYVSNLEPRSWPRGLDTEVFSRNALEQCAAIATEAYDREHVTPWLRRSPQIVRRNVALPHDRYASWRWTLDYPEDLAFIRSILSQCRPFPHLPSFDELRLAMEAHPDIAAINSHLV